MYYPYPMYTFIHLAKILSPVHQWGHALLKLSVRCSACHIFISCYYNGENFYRLFECGFNHIHRQCGKNKLSFTMIHGNPYFKLYKNILTFTVDVPELSIKLTLYNFLCIDYTNLYYPVPTYACWGSIVTARWKFKATYIGHLSLWSHSLNIILY